MDYKNSEIPHNHSFYILSYPFKVMQRVLQGQLQNIPQ